ncbi:putative P-type calcium ATPase [Taphrina deformans PYCC 5710]|uniref:Calcium-transporting ATPase n=1 Tax=Taphrina deformans (strain PYCC 5710 / ATCC 11124 / CBS 356.35 / IMI 108563 / JCM 9778 / NBRC 8474) TaxID=1097556 RepID=R4X7Y1_TAPDE|nr:putative P-type calcium ATPase [Taphrina deformans PYCC 5710]|eukprot:CCG81565.1 putative P-type calcium ATPase [Taphrina deformans PYCC 5710]
MVPKISVDTTNLDPGRGEDFISPVNQHEMSVLGSDGEKQSHLLVPGNQIPGRSNTSDVSSTGWETSTANDHNEKGRHDTIQHGQGILHEFESEDTGSFAFTNKQLQALVDPKNLELLRQMGGLKGLCKGLHTDPATGLSWDETRIPVKVTLAEAQAAASRKSGHTQDFDQEPPVSFATPPPAGTLSKRPTFGGIKRTMTARSTMKTGEDKMLDRKAVYGTNVLPARKTKNIFQLMWIALQDKVLIILSVAAVVSLALGLYETFDGPPEIDPLTGEAAPHIEWVEGVAIIVAIAIVTVVGSANDYQKERQFAKLNKKKEDRKITIVRSGRISRMSVFDTVVGDVLQFEPGDVLPVDGVLIAGHNVRCDESAATGESDTLKKTPTEESLELSEAGESLTKKTDPFMLSGAKVVEGVGTYLVTAVGPRSFNGKTMMALQTETEDTPLQAKLNNIATTIAKLGGAAALLLFIVAFIEYLIRLRNNNGTPSQKGQEFLDLFIIAVTVVVVAIPEGLPLAVTLALAFATTRMLKDNNLVRILKSCETMGVATTICSDKTGTLTQNRMTVVAGTISTSCNFAHSPEDSVEPTGDLMSQSSSEGEQSAARSQLKVDNHLSSGVSTITKFVGKLSSTTKATLLESIALNSTAFEGVDEHGMQGFVGSKTETALLEFAKLHLGMQPVATVRANSPSVFMIPFSSAKKCMGVVVQHGNGVRLHVKGASEIVLGYCDKTIQDPFMDDQITQPISSSDRERLLETIEHYAQESLRTIGIVYKDFQQWPPANIQHAPDGSIDLNYLFTDMTLVGIVGIMDPLRPGVKQAVLDCQGAGVKVRMVTGDNLTTAKAIATECGIFTGGLVMEGPQFRKLSTIEMDQVIPRLEVLARSSPEDKQTLVKRLKLMDEVVAVTGDGTNDGPALKMADVGFSMGIAGTEVAKEASAIILMDDNFSSIVKAMAWGRAVNDAVKKFLQFQITVNITAVVITFVSTVSGSDETSVLTAVQLLWVNLIMDTLAALALATDPPTPSILQKPPAKKSDGLISFDMWKMIIGQAIYQIVVVLVLFYAGQSIFEWPAGPNPPPPNLQGLEIRNTVVFNTFVWMQIFNQLNSRRLDSKLNVFEGILHNWFYWIINVVMVAGQIMIIFVGGAAFSVTRISGRDWAICLILGAISIPIAVIIRLIPNEVVRFFVPNFILTWNERRNVEISEESRAAWNPVVNQIRDELAFIRNIRSSRRIGSLGKQKKSTNKYFQGDKDRYKRAKSGSVAAALLSPSFVAASAAGFGPPSPRGPDDGMERFPSRSGTPTPQGPALLPK